MKDLVVGFLSINLEAERDSSHSLFHISIHPIGRCANRKTERRINEINRNSAFDRIIKPRFQLREISVCVEHVESEFAFLKIKIVLCLEDSDRGKLIILTDPLKVENGSLQ